MWVKFIIPIRSVGQQSVDFYLVHLEVFLLCHSFVHLIISLIVCLIVNLLKQAGTCISCKDLSVHKEYSYVKRDGIN